MADHGNDQMIEYSDSLNLKQGVRIGTRNNRQQKVEEEPGFKLGKYKDDLIDMEFAQMKDLHHYALERY